MADLMTFPSTVEEFMDQYKITDTEQIYTNGIELVPIFRMKQWFEHLPTADVPDRKVGKWINTGSGEECSKCHEIQYGYDSFRRYCPNCGAEMGERRDDVEETD